MKITKEELRRIIIEEYMISEGYWDHAGDDAAEELLKKIKGDDYESPEDRGHTRHITKGGDTTPMKKPNRPADETMPIDPDIPSDDAPERDVSGFQDRAGPSDGPLANQYPESMARAIVDLLSGADHNDAVDILTFAAETLGLTPPEEEPSTPYGGKAYDLRAKQQAGGKTGFEESTQLENLVALIKEVMEESGHSFVNKS